MCPFQRSVDFFSSGDVSGSVVCLYLSVAVRGFLSGDDFLTLLSWDKSVGYLKQVGGFTFVSASAFSVTKFVFLVTIVVMGLLVSGFICYSQEGPALYFVYVWLSSLHPFCLGFPFVPCVVCSISLAGFLTVRVSAPLCNMFIICCVLLCLSFAPSCLGWHGIFGSSWGIVVPGLLTGVGLGSVGADGLSCAGRRLRCHVGILYFVMGACAM